MKTEIRELNSQEIEQVAGGNWMDVVATGLVLGGVLTGGAAASLAASFGAGYAFGSATYDEWGRDFWDWYF